MHKPLCTERIATCRSNHTANRRVAPGPNGSFSRLDAGAQPLALGRKSVREVSASPLLLRSGARGDSPATCITSPPLPGPAARHWRTRHAPPERWTLWDSLDGCACRTDSPCPAARHSGRRGYAPADYWAVGSPAREVVPPALRTTHPLSSSAPPPCVSLRLGPWTQGTAGWTPSPRCAHLW